MNLRYAKRSEDTEQIAVINWARWEQETHPELKLLHHCPNGGSRHKAEAVKMKQMGVVAGIPDLCLPVPKGVYCGLYIELKYDDGRLEDSQKEMLALLAENGHYCAVCYGADEAIEVLHEYISMRSIAVRIQGRGSQKTALMTAPNLSIWKDGKVKPMKR